MTNLLATLSIILVTNWTTVSRTTPVCDRPQCLVAHLSTLNQVGVVATNLVATFVWKDRTNQIVLECVGSSMATLSRSIPDSQIGILWAENLGSVDIKTVITQPGYNSFTPD